MKQKVELLDILNKETIFDDYATITTIGNNGIQIEMKLENSTFLWKCYEKGIVIESRSDYIVVLTLKDNARTKGHIETEFGDIPLQCETMIYGMNDQYIEIKYNLIQNNEGQLFHFILKLDKEEYYGIH